MVRELTELQGTMGGIYAREEGLPETVWRAIYHHYLPTGVEADGAALARRSRAPASRGPPCRSPTSSTRWSGCSPRASGRRARAIRSASGGRRRALLRTLVDLPELTGLEVPIDLSIAASAQAREGVGDVAASPGVDAGARGASARRRRSCSTGCGTCSSSAGSPTTS